MAENSGIEWTHHTFNPWIGCTKVSAACDHCYAETWDNRFGGGHWGPKAPRRRTSDSNWQQPFKWNKAAAANGVRYRVFCASLADVFDNQVPLEWRWALWAVIKATPHLDWLLLTKRPQNIKKMLPEDWGAGWHNVWLGTTVENQVEANRRVPHLLAAPATVRFLSCEPLLGLVDLSAIDIDGYGEMDALSPCSPKEICDSCWDPETTGEPLDESIQGFEDEGFFYPPSADKPRGIDWVIAGGESGPHFRSGDQAWFRSLRDQCQSAGVPFLFKQWEGKSQREIKALGRQLDGVVWDQYPKMDHCI
jgi:protein gp37